MKRILLVLQAVLCLGLLGGSAWAGNIIAVPATGNTSNINVYGPDLQLLGNIPTPPAPLYFSIASIRNSDGTYATKYVVVSASAGKTIIFASSPLNVYPVAPSNLGSTPTAAELSGDSKYLALVSDTIHVFDTKSELDLNTGSFYLPGTPVDVALSPDSKTAYVLTPNSDTLTAVDLATFTVTGSVSVDDLSDAVSVSPTGQIYVSSPGQVKEYNRSDLSVRATITLNGKPGKFIFSPDFKYGLSPNTSPGGASILILDTTVRSAVGNLQIAGPGGGVVSIDKILMAGNNRAIAYSAALQKLYDISLNPLQYGDLVLTNVGTLQNISGFALSGETTPRFIYYSSNNTIYRYDFTNQVVEQTLLAFSGPLFNAETTATATGAPASLQPINSGLTLNPGATQYFAVRVFNASGMPLIGVQVTFTPDSGVSLVTPPVVYTDRLGFATGVVTAPAATGSFNIGVSAGTQNPIAGTLTYNVQQQVCTVNCGGGGSPSNGNLLRIQGDGQIVFPGLISEEAIVLALDNNGKPVPNLQVTWAGDGQAAFVESSPNTVTDSNGKAGATIYIGGFIGPLNPYITGHVTASTPLGSTTFTIIEVPFGAYPQQMIIKPGQYSLNFTLQAGTTLADAIEAAVATGLSPGVPYGVPIPGAGLSVRVPNDDGTVPTAHCADYTELTDQHGLAKCNLVAGGIVGTNNIKVVIGSLFSYSGTITITPGNPTNLQITGGNQQSGLTGTTLPTQLAVKLTDAGGNPLSGLPLTWSPGTPGSVTIVSASSTTASDGTGSATVKLGNIAGNVTVRVTSGNLSATFNLTVTVPVSTLVLVSGNNQGPNQIGDRFTNPLTVEADNASGQPVAGLVIVFTVTQGAATLGDSGASTVNATTGSDGRASVFVTPVSPAGNIVVTASFQTLTPITFTLSSRPRGPSITAGGFGSLLNPGVVGLVTGSYGVLTGTGIAPGVSGTLFANLLAPSLPTQMNGVSITFNNNPNLQAPLYALINFAGLESVIFLVPWELLGSNTVTITVNVNGGSSTVTGVPVREYAPAVLTVDGTNTGAPFVIRSDGQVVSTAYPARRGEKVRVLMLGLGQTSPPATTNHIAPDNAAVQGAMAVEFGSVIITLDNAGFLYQGYPGVYYVDMTIPANADLGSAVSFAIQFVPTGGTPLFAQDGLTLAISAQ